MIVSAPKQGLALTALCLMLATPALAYKWPGEGASLGAAISAKVIGRNCPAFMTPAEIAELDAYIAKATSELARQSREQASYRPFSYDAFATTLTADYERSFRNGRPCDADAAEAAQDTLRRVRKAMAGDAPLFPAPTAR